MLRNQIEWRIRRQYASWLNEGIFHLFLYCRYTCPVERAILWKIKFCFAIPSLQLTPINFFFGVNFPRSTALSSFTSGMHVLLFENLRIFSSFWLDVKHHLRSSYPLLWPLEKICFRFVFPSICLFAQVFFYLGISQITSGYLWCARYFSGEIWIFNQRIAIFTTSTGGATNW